GEPEGVVLVADHQSAGRGRAGRSWTAPPGASLLMTVLLRPPAEVVELTTMAMAVAAAEAVEALAGFAPRLKWPNDLVWPGDGTGPDRKLAGILAEADWPSVSEPPETVAVVVGIGINVAWPPDLPAELAEIAIACNHVVEVRLDREDLLVALLERLEAHYAGLLAGEREPLLAAWRTGSATLGRRVRVELDGETVEGIATDITAAGHLLIDTDAGARSVIAGDVIHLRPA
ncbi:MAG: biotin--[acetyl-CoA-carboxylase] ligase, partial [Microthrixaceae bacterium]